MKRITDTLNRLRSEPRGGLSIYLPFGYPDLDASEAAMSAAIESGADWLELGIPFSDPAADGPIIAAATHRGVAQGLSLDDCLAAAARLRARHPGVPLVAMTYANLAVQAGYDGFAQRLADAGIDGCILADVPMEESGPIRSALQQHGIAWIPLVAPTTSADRMAAIAATGSGFLYVVGNVGPTGQADPGAFVEDTLRRARAATDLPLALGFGIATPEDVARVVAAGADAAIVGSRAVTEQANGAPAVGRFVASLREAL